MENLTLWNKISKPPTTALKAIGAGRLKGKSDINPQWRYQSMTDHFGPCGVGWKFTVDRKWTEPAPDNQVFAFADISLYYKRNDSDGWSEAIPGNGGSMLVAKESNGLHASDEAYKMAITDALGTAMKMLGMAAEIYLGNFDGSKYKDEAVSSPKSTQNIPKESKSSSPEALICMAAVKDISHKDGETNGKKWRRYGVQDDNENWYSTFSETLVDIANSAKTSGEVVALHYTEKDGPKGPMRNLTDIEVISQTV